LYARKRGGEGGKKTVEKFQGGGERKKIGGKKKPDIFGDKEGGGVGEQELFGPKGGGRRQARGFE